jgi:glycosyltransferase involved in cell wall biosynthesis
MNKCSKNEIIFLQPGYAHYRNELFKILSKRHDIHFIFEHSSNTYPGRNLPTELSCTFLDQKNINSQINLIYYLLKQKPNTIISSVSTSFRSIVSFVYAKLFRKRFILWIIEWRKPKYSSDLFKNFLRYCKKIIGAKIIRGCNSLIVGGLASMRYAESLGKASTDIFLALQSANDLKQDVVAEKRKVRKKADKFTFLYLSRIIPRKGLDILLKAFYLLRSERNDVSLLIGGEGSFRKHCQKIVSSLEIPDIAFLGPLDPNYVVDIYNKADVFILPSYFYENSYEAWGLVINEAMSMSLPVITTTAVGAAYDMVVDGYNGYIIKENDVINLYKTMDKILGKDIIRMGMNSRILFEKKNNFVQMANGFTLAIEHAEPI